ncbi:Complement C1q-like protein 4 [Mactra antiquata]
MEHLVYLLILGICSLNILVYCENIDNGINQSEERTLLQRIEELERLTKKNEEINRAQAQEISQLKKDLHQEKKKNNSDGKLTKRQGNETPVAFYGKMLALNSNSGNVSNQVIKFDKIITNIGNAYQSNTGRITVPVSGIYVFSLTAMASYRTDTHVGIYVNDQLKTYLKLNGPEHEFDTMTQTAVYYLHQFDNVSVKHTKTNATLRGDYTAFTGFLLEQDYGYIISNGNNIVG